MIEEIQSQLYRLILHQQNQKWAIAVIKGKELIYPHQKTLLTPDLVTKHLQGEITIGVMLLQQESNVAKAGCIDIDIPRDAPILKDALEIAYKVQQAAFERNLHTYIEFSGNRGFHVWLFVELPIPGNTWLSLLKKITNLAGFSAKEFFPNHHLTESKCIKLPGAIHLKSNRRAGFIADNPEWDAEGFPVLPDQENLMKDFIQNKLSDIALLVDSAEIKSSIESNFSDKTLEKTESNFADFPLDEHPGCIQHLLNFGAPISLHYNNVNMTIASYTLAREMTQETAINLAEEIACATRDNHPTSKDLSGKISNFKSAYKSASQKNYQWECSYILAGINTHNTEALSSRGCIGEKCSLWPYKHQPFNTEKPKGLNAAIWSSITILVSAGKEIRLSTLLLELEAITPQIVAQEITPAIALREKEVLAYLLHYPEMIVEALALNIPPEGFISGSIADSHDYLESLFSFNPCTHETFLSYLQQIRDTAIRILAAKQIIETQQQIQDDDLPPATILDTLVNNSQNLLKRAVSEVLPMTLYSHQLMTDLFSQSLLTIPTPSQWLNHILNGGLAQEKLYIFGAPPGGGKTTFCNWLGDYAASLGIPVLVAAYEMSRMSLWVYSLARLAAINSAWIERKQWLNNSNHEYDLLLQNITQAAENYHNKIAPNISILECGPEYTVAKLKGAIAQLRHRLKLDDDTPFLVVVDYLQLMLTGDEKIDNSAMETLRVSRIATDLKRLARDTKTAVLAISDITKVAYIQALSSGSLDMSALRDSFKIAHAADVVGLLQTGKITVGRGDMAKQMDQLELAQQKYTTREKQRLIEQARLAYPLNEVNRDTYARLTILKNRGGILAEPLFVYQKAHHNFQPIDLQLTGGNDEEGL